MSDFSRRRPACLYSSGASAHVRLLQRTQHIHAASVLGGLGFDGGVAIDTDKIEHIRHVEMVEGAR